MQVYTKILIGMVVGALVGGFLGPNAATLEHDLYVIPDGRGVEVRLKLDEPSSKLNLPKAPLELAREGEVRRGTFKDVKGEPVELITWIAVSFKVTDQINLLGGDALHKQIGEVKTGARVQGWLKIEHTALESGGFILSPQPVSSLGTAIIDFLKPIGALFMRLIKMVIVPLVFASLLVGVAGLGDVRKLGRVGGKTLGLYLITTAIAIMIGLTVAHFMRPGDYIAEADRAALVAQFSGSASTTSEAAAKAPSMTDNILAFVPENPIQALSSGDMLQVIFFAAILGVALTMIPVGNGRVVVNFFDRIQQAMIVIIHMVMALAPYGVAALIAEVVGTSGLSILKALLVYGLAVLLGLAIHAGVVYGGLVRWKAKISWFAFMKAIRPAQLIAFSTSSSSAALPISIECAEENLGVSSPVASFVLPLGATVNMDGTALYQGVAAIFIAQVFQIDLTLMDQLAIVFAATMASVGAAGVPGAGMITLAMVLTSAGIPQVGLALILGMDRLLDMFRTAVNVTGDMAVTSVMAVSEGEVLSPLTSGRDRADPARGFERRLEHSKPKPILPDHEMSLSPQPLAPEASPAVAVVTAKKKDEGEQRKKKRKGKKKKGKGR